MPAPIGVNAARVCRVCTTQLREDKLQHRLWRGPACAACHSRADMATQHAGKERPKQQRQAHYSSYLQVLNVDNTTAAPSVLLFFDKERYLFNVGEGMQRHMREYKVKFNKVDHMFFTRTATETLAGLPGLLLTNAPTSDVGELIGPQAVAQLHGAPGLQVYVNAFRQYSPLGTLKVTESGRELLAKQAPEGSQAAELKPVVQSPVVAITPIPLAPQDVVAEVPMEQAASASEPSPLKRPAEPALNGSAASAADALDNAPSTAEQPAAGAEEPGVQQPDSKRQKTQGRDHPEALNGRPSAQQQQQRLRGSDIVMSYLCQLSTIPGKLDPAKAASLGVPKGKLLGELQRGNAVTAVNGRQVHPHEVMDPPSTPGPSVLIVDCPDERYVPALQQAPAIVALAAECREQGKQQQQQQPGQGQQGAAAGEAQAVGRPAPGGKLSVIVHLGGAHVLASPVYRQWMDSFGGGCTHLKLSADSQQATTARCSALLQAQLNLLEPSAFQLGAFAEQPALQQQVQQGPAGAPIVAAPNLCKVVLCPTRHQGLDCSEVPQPLDLAAQQAAMGAAQPEGMQAAMQAYEAAREQMQSGCEQQAAQQADDPVAPMPAALVGISRRQFELTLLGTASACPSKYRNVSGYYVDLFDKGGLMVDCGEDSMGQMERRFGREDTERRVRELRAVWVSHMHADHHGGLYPLLARRAALLGRDAAPMLIMGPWGLFRVLGTYSQVLPLSFHFLPNAYFAERGQAGQRLPPPHILASLEAARRALGLVELEAFPVQHVAQSFGIKLVSEAGWKVVFSGDTRPCQAVIDAARGAALLVHEATFDDELAAEAIAKHHSTTAEAVGIARAAGAFRMLLTHFSTRYPKVPVLKGASSDSVAVGFDLMSVNLADLAWLPQLVPVLDVLFREEQQKFEAEDAAE